MSRHWRRGSGGALVTILLALGVLTHVPSASAVGCTVRSGGSSSTHSAWIYDPDSTCSWIRVRHRYDPVWSMNNFWTQWAGGSGNGPYYTASTAVYLYYETEHG